MVVPSSPWPRPRRTLHCNTTATPSQARHCCVRHDLSPGRARSGGDGVLTSWRSCGTGSFGTRATRLWTRGEAKERRRRQQASKEQRGWVGPRQQATSNRQHRLPFPTHSTRSRRRGLPLEGPGPGGGGGGGEVVPTTIDGVSTLSVSLHAQLPVARCSCRVGLPFESPPSPRASRTPRRCRPQALCVVNRCMVPAQQVCFHRSSTRCWHRLLAVDASLCRVLCVFCCSCTVPSG